MHITQGCFYFLDNLKMYHWNTHSFARHKASDDCFAAIQKLVDQFVETYIGKYGRQAILKSCSHSVKVMNDVEAVKLFHWFVSFIQQIRLRASDSDLINIRDEMLSQLNQCLYLMTLDSGLAYSPKKRSTKKRSSRRSLKK